MIAAYTALLYGLSYLEYAVRSIIDFVDEYHVIYSPVGAHGYRTDLVCSDSRKDLLQAAQRVAGHKLRWHDDGPFPYEGAQRDSIFRYVPDADVILPIDYDEIAQPGLIELMLAAGTHSNVRNWRIPFRHFWRSFNKGILHDPAYPVRMICPKIPNGETTLDTGGLAYNHCGYSITPAMMAYKWLLHGHKNELRRDIDWFHERYMNKEAKTDLHPVGSIYWDYEMVDPTQYFPSWMAEHPWWGLDWIE